MPTAELPGEPENRFVSFCSKGEGQIHLQLKGPVGLCHLGMGELEFYDRLWGQAESEAGEGESTFFGLRGRHLWGERDLLWRQTETLYLFLISFESVTS